MPCARVDGLAAIAIPLFIAGCAAPPQVRYTKITQPSDAKGITDSFYLAQSEITIDKVSDSDDDAGKVKQVQYNVSSKPIEYTEFKIGIQATRSPLTSTMVNVTKQDNTDLVASIGIETTDNTKTLIEEVGGVIVKVIALGAVAGAPPPVGGKAPDRKPVECIPPDKFPVKITLSATAIKGTQPISFDASGSEASVGCIKISVEKLPPDAAPVETLPYNSATSNYYYSACRSATVAFDQVKKELRIADPNNIQFVQLPYKGAVTMHTQCGVSVKTEKSGSDVTGAQVVDALLAQGKSIKDALAAANKKPDAGAK